MTINLVCLLSLSFFFTQFSWKDMQSIFRPFFILVILALIIAAVPAKKSDFEGKLTLANPSFDLAIMWKSIPKAHLQNLSKIGPLVWQQSAIK